MRGPTPMGGMSAFFRRRWRMLTPEQQMNSATLEQEKIRDVLAKQDARYDSMTEEGREQYYLKPSLLTKIKKAFRGQ
jgi:hypothetical protein